MMTVKDLMLNPDKSSPDGEHWEPAIPSSHMLVERYWRFRLRDAWAVWKGKAIAVRQTTKADIKENTWGGLTDVEIDYLLVSTAGENEETHISFARAIEAKLKQKNG